MTDPIGESAAAMERMLSFEHDLDAGRRTRQSPLVNVVPQPDGNPFVLADDFKVIRREPVASFLDSDDGLTTMLGPGMTFTIGGPSDASKSIALFDLVGKLSSPGTAGWLGLHVQEEALNIGLIVYPGEGADEDVLDRLNLLVPAGARLHVWDHWRWVPAPRADMEGVAALAGFSRERQLHGLAFDTWSSFFRGAYEIKSGAIPEDAHDAVVAVRSQADLPLAFIGNQHTRKLDRRAVAPADELEELAGTFARKVDGAVVLRKDGDNKRRRRVTYAKTRRGPKPDPVIATLPDDPDAPPRFTVVVQNPEDLKPGTTPDEMAAWIKEHDEPAGASALRVQFGIAEATLRDRRPGLEAEGIAYNKAPWLGTNARAYGTRKQWLAAHARRFGTTISGIEAGEDE